MESIAHVYIEIVQCIQKYKKLCLSLPRQVIQHSKFHKTLFEVAQNFFVFLKLSPELENASFTSSKEYFESLMINLSLIDFSDSKICLTGT